MRSRTGILFVVTALIGATVAWCVWPARRQQSMASVATRRQHTAARPVVQMVDMHLMAQLGDKAILQVVAKRAVSSGIEQHATVHEIQAKMQQKNGRVWHISAARGLLDRVTGDMTAQGGVRLYEKDGYVIETEDLSLLADERILQTDTPVTMHGNAVVIVGTGLRHEIDKNRITLQHQVKASFQYGREQRASEGKMALGGFVVDHRVRSFGHGTTWSKSESDTDPDH